MSWLDAQIKKGAACRYCGANTDLSIDHIIPRSKKGANVPSNFQVLCSFCNSTKTNHTEKEFAEILRDIKHRGIWYSWEHKYAAYLEWLEFGRNERGLPPLDFSINI